MSEAVLNLKKVCHSYRMGKNSLEVLKGVNFTLFSGEWCCIYGASGSGKTTLLNLIGGLETPDSGTIMIGDVDISKLSRRAVAKFRAANIGFIFQSYHLLPELTALENVALAGTIAGKNFNDAKKQAKKLLAQVGLSERLYHRPQELSGGEQQRTAIARSLINDPALILADEPTGNLDPHTGESILELFQELRVNRTILMITHNPDIAQIASRSVKLQDGIIA